MTDDGARLRRVLDGGDPEDRVAAVEAVGSAPEPGTREALADAVLDPHEAVQREAIRAAGRLQLEVAVGALAALLDRADDTDRREAVVRALGRIGTADAVPPLLAAVDDGPRAPALQAVAGLEGLEGEGVAELLLDGLETALEDDPDAADAFAAALRSVEGPAAIRAVRERQRSSEGVDDAIGQLEHYEAVRQEHGLVSVAAFESPDPFLRRDAADRAGGLLQPADGDAEPDRVDVGLGDELRAYGTDLDAEVVLDHLLALLEDDDPEVRVAAATSVPAAGDRRAVGPIFRSATRDDADDEAVEAHFAALLVLWPDRELELLLHHAKTAAGTHAHAAGSLGWWLADYADVDLPSVWLSRRFAGRTARRELRDAGEGERPPDGLAALAVAGSERDVELLLDALESPRAEVRAQAATALGTLGCSLHRFSTEPVAHRAGFTLEDVGAVRDERVAPALLDALAAETDPHAAARLADALGMYGESAAVEPLLELLDRPEPYVREKAAGALGRIGDQRAVDPLVDRLRDDEDELVRAAAAGALGAIGHVDALDALEAALRGDESVRVRRLAAGAVGQFDSRASDLALEEARQVDEADEVREAAWFAAGPRPFRGTRLEGPARTARRKLLLGLNALLAVGWAVGPWLRAGLGRTWSVLRPGLVFVWNAFLGWLVLLALFLLVVLVVNAGRWLLS